MASSARISASVHNSSLPDPRGATLLGDGRARFNVWAPNASRVSVRILTGDARGVYALERSEGGEWTGEVAGAEKGDDYRFVLERDGEQPRELPDPVSRWQPEGVHGPSRIVDPDVFGWRDQQWRGVTMQELVIYELHIGTFTQGGTFDAAIEELPSLRELGITAIEVMPVAEFPGSRNWGYDGVHLYAPQSSYGGPDGLRRLVDAAHEQGLGVLLDVVYNHVGPEGNYLDAFGPYFTEAYRTPWGRAVNYDGAHSDEVRRWVLDNARYWIREFHIDGLRLDAVHGIFDHGAVHLLQEIGDAVRTEGERSGRSTVCIAESDLNDPRMIRAPRDGGYGLDGQWSDDFHHAVHAALTGERSGYYEDYGPVEAIASVLREPFLYAGQYSRSRKRRHGAPSTGIGREHFVVAIQNHDQVGNRAAGDRLASLVSPAQYRLAASLLLLAPYVPLIFMGEEYGETNPFQYFVHHSDPALVDAVRQGRRAEFEAFGWGDAVPDPQEESTFERSRVERLKRSVEGHIGVYRLYATLLQLRAQEAELRPSRAPESVQEEAGLITMRRGGFTAAFNCSDATRSCDVSGELVFASESEEFGGAGGVRPAQGRVALPPWSAVLIRNS